MLLSEYDDGRYLTLYDLRLTISDHPMIMRTKRKLAYGHCAIGDECRGVTGIIISLHHFFPCYCIPFFYMERCMMNLVNVSNSKLFKWVEELRLIIQVNYY
jgi:hypothetical protein